MAKVELKQPIVEEISGYLKEAQSVVLVDYRGLTVEQDTQLRKAMREAGVVYKVYKNTLLRKALNELGYTQFDEDLKGPTAVAFANDETSAAKVMVAASKDYTDKIVLKSAFVDNAYVDKNGIKAVASMPSKEELIAKMLGSMQAPIANFAGVLNNLLSGIVRVLDQVAKSKA